MLSIDVLMSAGLTELAMFISEVCVIVPRGDGRARKMAFSFGFFIVVGLRFDSKYNLNSDPLSYIK